MWSRCRDEPRKPASAVVELATVVGGRRRRRLSWVWGDDTGAAGADSFVPADLAEGTATAAVSEGSLHSSGPCSELKLVATLGRGRSVRERRGRCVGGAEVRLELRVVRSVRCCPNGSWPVQ